MRSPAETQCETSSHQPSHDEDLLLTSEEYKGLAGQFSTLVIISTFTSTLIVAFLSLARDITTEDPTPRSTLHFEIGMLLGLSAMGIHIGVIVVGGRAAALCFRLAAATSHTTSSARRQAHADLISHMKEVDFYRYTKYCDQLQLIGAIVLLSAFLLLAFSLFTHWQLPWILLAASVVGGCSVFMTGFWTASVTGENVRQAWVAVRRSLGRGKPGKPQMEFGSVKPKEDV
ncbi:hypothetical protein Hypma_003840 [Hypsizygus marmoreus]|uniref:Uncharacterized protein n=1 Tax=Hypsizygus marmoreus TaxID=39966 RepID=A0A369JYQ9_HYPMA|nr:hypothetical protein Hypma_003840 [Hypsizygus marmoreus]